MSALVVGLVGYLLVAHPAFSSWLLLSGFVVASAAWIWFLGDIVRSLLRKPPRSRADWVRLTASVLWQIGITLVLASVVDQHHGWTHGAATSALVWGGCGLVWAGTCLSAGERRFGPAMRARAAGRQEPSG
jgi:hypothetical protein